MNTTQLECFVTVAEGLNFSKAAVSLKMTQPAVSHQIRSLEEELEVKLFRRTSKNVSLTQEGLLFLADAHLILKTALTARKRLEDHTHFIPFELGCHNHLEMNLLPPVLKILSQDFPLLRPAIHLVPFPALLDMVENGQLHAALGIKEEQKKSPLSFKDLFSAPICCICSPDHPLAGHETLTKRQLSGTLIACSPRHIPDSVFAVQNSLLMNLSPEQRFLTESLESALTLAKAGLGYTLYPQIPGIHEPGLCAIPVTTLPAVSFGVYCAASLDHPVLKTFLRLMGQTFSS